MRVDLLTGIQRRVELLEAVGMHHVHVCDFTTARAAQQPAEFIQSVLIELLGATHVVIGQGFRFGKGAAGTAEDFREAGLVVHEVEQVLVHGSRVSSTRIRELIARGEVAGATELLSREHRFEGVVVPGHKRGRDLGYPTANIEPQWDQSVPADGVYAGWLRVLDENGLSTQQWPAAISVGTNPTFDDVTTRVVEAYALHETTLELYGLRVAVDFVDRVRGMEKFSSLEDLIAAMGRDVSHTERILGLA
jgi:riboflavin kinase/FMN adenylyltransferase